MVRKICGVDEAGKGPVLGSMFISGVVIEEDKLPRLMALGVKDSKKLTKRNRAGIYRWITDNLETHTVEVTATRIDEWRKLFSLNDLLVNSYAKVIDFLKPDLAYIDAADVNAKRFGLNVFNKCETELDVVAEHKADEKYPTVSAASIVAKVERDAHMERLREEYDIDLGSGYPSDPKTKQALRYIIKSGEKHPFIRYSWKTLEEARKGALRDV